MGVDPAQFIAELIKLLQMPGLDAAICLCVDEFLCAACGLQQNTPGILLYFVGAFIQRAAVRRAGPVFAVSAAGIGGTSFAKV